MIRISKLFAARGIDASLSERVSKRSVARLAGVAAAGLAATVTLNNAAASDEHPKISKLFAARGIEASLSERVSKRSVPRLAGVAAAKLAAMVDEHPKISRLFAARGIEASLSERVSKRSVARPAGVAAARPTTIVALNNAAASDEYPVVFLSYDAVEPLGISLDYERPFQNKCYHYGSGGYHLSISNDVLSRFTRRGFSVQSVCLGLVSGGNRYDPETGRRMPTYVIFDKPAMEGKYTEGWRQQGIEVTPGPEEDYISEELPLDLPDCFKNGNPYTDCVFRFDRITGKLLTPEQTNMFARLGTTIDKELRKETGPVVDGFYDSDDESEEVRGFRRSGDFADYVFADPKLKRLLFGKKGYSNGSFWARSASLPRGYGYALDADGSMGPSVSEAAVASAISGSKKPQISVEELRRRLNEGR
jgi:hypothetical protein